MSNPLTDPQALGLEIELIDEGLYALLFQTGAVDWTLYVDGPALDALIEKLNKARSRDIDDLVSEVDVEELKLLGDLPAGTLRLGIPPLGPPEGK